MDDKVNAQSNIGFLPFVGLILAVLLPLAGLIISIVALSKNQGNKAGRVISIIGIVIGSLLVMIILLYALLATWFAASSPFTY